MLNGENKKSCETVSPAVLQTRFRGRTLKYKLNKFECVSSVGIMRDRRTGAHASKYNGTHYAPLNRTSLVANARCSQKNKRRKEKKEKKKKRKTSAEPGVVAAFASAILAHASLSERDSALARVLKLLFEREKIYNITSKKPIRFVDPSIFARNTRDGNDSSGRRHTLCALYNSVRGAF